MSVNVACKREENLNTFELQKTLTRERHIKIKIKTSRGMIDTTATANLVL